jgi:translation initiation factor IF-1
MVKNVKGGSNHKRFARKNLAIGRPERTRLADPTEKCEMYAVVIKMYGQGMCEVRCNDGIIRNCVIRKKFSGRNKGANKIMVDVKVLVGLRDWEVITPGKLHKCDLLEVYDSRSEKDLKKDPRANWKFLMSDNEKLGCDDIDDAIIFDADIDEESEHESDKQDDDDDIDLDDI